MADYSKSQNAIAGVFKQSMQTFTERFEDLSLEIMNAMDQNTEIINASILGIAKYIKNGTKAVTASPSSYHEARTDSTGAATDYMGFIAGGMADIVSFLYEKPYTIQQLGTARTGIEAFLSSKKEQSANGSGAGKEQASSEGIAINSATDAIKNIIEFLENHKIDGHEADVKNLNVILKGISDAINSVDVADSSIIMINKISVAATKIINTFEELAKNSTERIVMASAGEASIKAISKYFTVFSEVFNETNLTELSRNISRINASQIDKLISFWDNIQKILNYSGNVKNLYKITISTIIFNLLSNYFDKFNTLLIPKLNELDKSVQGLGNVDKSIGRISSIFKELASIGTASISVVVTAPFVILAAKLSKRMMVASTELANTINFNSAQVQEASRNMKPYKDIIMGMVIIIGAIVAVGFAAHYIKHLATGAAIMLAAVVAMVSILAGLSLLQNAMNKVGGVKEIQKPVIEIRTIIQTALVTIAAILVLGLLAPVIKPIITSGIGILAQIFISVIGMCIGVGLVLKLLGGVDTIEAPLKSIIKLVLGAAATILLIIFVSNFVRGRLGELKEGILLVTGSLLLIVAAFRIAVSGIIEANPKSMEQTVKLLIALMVFSVVNILLMILVSKLLTWEEIAKSLIVPATLLVIAFAFKMVAKAVSESFAQQTNLAILSLLALTVVSAAVIFFMGKYMKAEYLVGIAAFIVTLFAIVYAFIFIYEQLKVLPWQSFLKSIGMLLAATTASALVFGFVSMIGAHIDILAVGKVLACILGFTYIMWFINKIDEEGSIKRGVLTMVCVAGAIAANAHALYIMALTVKQFADVEWEAMVKMAVIVIGAAIMCSILGGYWESVLIGTGVLSAIAGAIMLNSISLIVMADTAIYFNEVDDAAIDKMSAVIIGVALIAAPLGIPYVAGLISLGCATLSAIAGAIMLNSIALRFLAITVNEFAAMNLQGLDNFKTTIWAFALTVAPLALFLTPILLGGLALTTLSLTILLCSAGLFALKWVSDIYDEEDILSAAGRMCTIVGTFAMMLAMLGPLSPVIIPGAGAMVTVAGSILSNCIALYVLAEVSHVYDDEDMLISITRMGLIIGVYAAALAALGVVAPLIGGGASAMVLLAGSIVANSLALYVLAELSHVYDDETVLASITRMGLIIGIYAAALTALGVVAPLIGGGASAMVLLAGSIVANSLALTVLYVIASNFYSDASILPAIERMGIIIGIYATALTGLGAVAPLIGLGASAMVLASGSILTNSAALILLAFVAGMYSDPGIVDKVIRIGEIIGVYAGALAALSLISPAIIVGAAAMTYIAASIAITAGAMALVISVCDMITPQVEQRADKIGPLLKKVVDSFNSISIVSILELSEKAPVMRESIADIGKSIEITANAVSNMASLRIPVYDGTEITSYRELTDADFDKAASNTAKVISCIGKSIIDLYYGRADGMTAEEAMQMFNSKKDQDTPFAKVVKSTIEIGTMLSSIAKGVGDYAALSIPEYTGNEITGYKKLTKDDFEHASENIKTVVSTIARSLISLYNENPDFFKTKKDDSIFGRMMESTSKLGGMISTIAEGVGKMSSLSFEKFDEHGESIGTVNLSANDFDQAGKNIKSVVTTIVSALGDLYNNSEYKKFLKGDDSELKNMITRCNELGSMIGTVAENVLKFSSATYTKYDTDGKELGTFQVGKAEYTAVGTNLNLLFDSIFSNLSRIHNKYNKFFKNNEIMDSLSKNLTAAIQIVSSAAKNIVDIVSLKVPVYTGDKVTGYNNLVDTDFTKASKNIFKVITTVLKSLYKIYTDKSTSKLFKQTTDANGKPLPDTLLGKITSALKPAMTLLSDMAKVVTEYAKARFPKYNADGKIIGYESLKEDDYKAMGTSISTLLTALITSLDTAYNNPIISEVVNSPNDNIITKISTAFTPCLDFLSKTASTVAKIANNKFETVDKNGNKKSVVLTSQQYKEAGENVGNVITTLVQAMADLAKNEKYSDIWNNFNNSPIKSVIKVSTEVGNMIGSLAENIIKLAGGEYKYKDEHGKEHTGSMANLDVNSLSVKLKDIITKPIDKMVEISELQNFIQFKDNGVDVKIKDVCKQVISAISSIQDVSVQLNEKRNLTFSTDSINAYNEFIRNFNIEAVKTDVVQRIDATRGLITSVNSLDLSKADSFIELIRQLNLMASRLGGLDNFTKVLSDTLAVQLNRLTTQLMDAARKMELSDKIRLERERSIKNAMEEINNMLDKPINVKPFTEEDNDDDTINIPSQPSDDSEKINDPKNTTPPPSKDNNLDKTYASEGQVKKLFRAINELVNAANAANTDNQDGLQMKFSDDWAKLS